MAFKSLMLQVAEMYCRDDYKSMPVISHLLKIRTTEKVSRLVKTARRLGIIQAFIPDTFDKGSLGEVLEERTKVDPDVFMRIIESYVSGTSYEEISSQLDVSFGKMMGVLRVARSIGVIRFVFSPPSEKIDPEDFPKALSSSNSCENMREKNLQERLSTIISQNEKGLEIIVFFQQSNHLQGKIVPALCNDEVLVIKTDDNMSMNISREKIVAFGVPQEE
jgi:DNA-binding transcriptional regulator LsrR (DeoR family)